MDPCTNTDTHAHKHEGMNIDLQGILQHLGITSPSSSVPQDCISGLMQQMLSIFIGGLKIMLHSIIMTDRTPIKDEQQ